MNWGKFGLYILLVILAVVLVRNAAGVVAILLGGGAEANAFANTLEGGTKKTSNKGTFKTGSTSIKLG